MENAVDALKIAGSVLLFVMAISVAILSFGQVRQVSDVILDYRDRETVYIDGNYYYEASGTERSVGLETIIPTIYRAYFENYKIVFDENLLGDPIYTITLNNTTQIPKYTLDLETNEDSGNINIVLANDEQKLEFLCGILYGSTYAEDFKDEFNRTSNVKIDIPEQGLYKRLSNRLQSNVITEYLGVYYQDDNEDVPEVMKQEKRIITYRLGT
mgnify:FL=1